MVLRSIKDRALDNRSYLNLNRGRRTELIPTSKSQAVLRDRVRLSDIVFWRRNRPTHLQTSCEAKLTDTNPKHQKQGTNCWEKYTLTPDINNEPITYHFGTVLYYWTNNILSVILRVLQELWESTCKQDLPDHLVFASVQFIKRSRSYRLHVHS